jgi:hypothetical protein
MSEKGMPGLMALREKLGTHKPLKCEVICGSVQRTRLPPAFFIAVRS